MAINLTSTNTVKTSGVKILAYGASGSGKTSLIATLPNPVILSAEAGLLSLAGHDIPFINIDDMETLREAYGWAKDCDHDTICLDSISEIAEVCLATEKKNNKDPRAAYGEMQSTMAELVRAFRDIPGKNIYMTAKLDKSTDEMGRVLYAPSMPGIKAGQALPYQFDIVTAVRVEKDSEGVTQRALMLESDGLWMAKDRSGKLSPWESPNLGDMIKKIGGE